VRVSPGVGASERDIDFVEHVCQGTDPTHVVTQPWCLDERLPGPPTTLAADTRLDARPGLIQVLSCRTLFQPGQAVSRIPHWEFSPRRPHTVHRNSRRERVPSVGHRHCGEPSCREPKRPGTRCSCSCCRPCSCCGSHCDSSRPNCSTNRRATRAGRSDTSPAPGNEHKVTDQKASGLSYLIDRFGDTTINTQCPETQGHDCRDLPPTPRRPR